MVPSRCRRRGAAVAWLTASVPVHVLTSRPARLPLGLLQGVKGATAAVDEPELAAPNTQ